MNKQREALEAALKDLEAWNRQSIGLHGVSDPDTEKAIALIKEALAEQQSAEPVAWLQIGVGDNEGIRVVRDELPKKYDKEWWRFEPLYLAPPTTDQPDLSIPAGVVDIPEYYQHPFQPDRCPKPDEAAQLGLGAVSADEGRLQENVKS
jgi:hypothetical protein